MGYIGKAHQSTSVPARTVSMLTGDGTTTTLTLSQAPMSASNVSVFFDGVAQTPGTDYTLSGSTLTFTSVPPAACVVCAIVGGGENISSPMDGSVTDESIVAGAITNAKIASVAASKLTGAAFSALDASNVTFGVQQNLFTKSAADPEETSNVTLGTIWVNTLSGEMFVCIDATTDQNSFMNVGTGTLSIFGNVIPGEPTDNVPDMTSSTSVSHTFTGGTDDDTVTHYHVDQISDSSLLSVAAAEVAAGSPHVFTTTSVSADTNVTFRVRTKDNDGAYSNGITVTVIVIAPWAYGGTIAGFQAGGADMTGAKNNMNKIDFSTGANSTLGVKTLGLMSAVNGSSSTTHGYIFGGAGGAYGNYAMYTEKFSFTSYAQSSNIANLTEGVSEPAGGHNTETHGWRTAGAVGATPYRSNRADKISFASDTSWTHTNTLNYIRKAGSGMSSLTYGYTAGGHIGNPTNIQAYQEKFSFSSNGGSTNVANLIQARETPSGASSSTHGYTCGGWATRIDRINFSNDNEQTDVGVLSEMRAAGQSSSSTTHAYVYAGWYRSSVDKFSFASATPSVDQLPDLPVHYYHGASGLQY
jgi:hypothetical protein